MLYYKSEEQIVDNNTLFVSNFPTHKDRDPETVSATKTWKKMGSIYKCPNCGYIPTCVSIAELKKCPKCEIIKTFYETQHGLEPIFVDEE